MPSLVVAPRIRGFICLNAHPGGCALNVQRQVALAEKGAGGGRWTRALVTSFVPALTLIFGQATGNAWWHPGIVLAVMSAITLVAALFAARRTPIVDEV